MYRGAFCNKATKKAYFRPILKLFKPIKITVYKFFND